MMLPTLFFLLIAARVLGAQGTASINALHSHIFCCCSSTCLPRRTLCPRCSFFPWERTGARGRRPALQKVVSYVDILVCGRGLTSTRFVRYMLITPDGFSMRRPFLRASIPRFDARVRALETSGRGGSLRFGEIPLITDRAIHHAASPGTRERRDAIDRLATIPKPPVAARRRLPDIKGFAGLPESLFIFYGWVRAPVEFTRLPDAHCIQ